MNISNKNTLLDKLRQLQATLQEEIALRDIFFEDRESLLKKIENNCIEYYKIRIAIQEIYDNNSQSDSTKKKLKYIFCDEPKKVLSQVYGNLSNLMFCFHDNNEILLKLIACCPKDSYEQLANIICNFFYVNIFSTTFLNENLLTLIYLLLEKEIDRLDIKADINENFSNQFLDINKSFLPYLFRHLARKDEIKTFLENILKKILLKTSGLLNKKGDNLFLGFTIEKLLAFLNRQDYQLESTNKSYKSYLDLLTMEIKKCKLNNNFYSIVDKENFDNYLIEDSKNLENEDDENNSYLDEGFENFLIKSGFYSKNNDRLEEEKKEDELDIYNGLYSKELDKETLIELIENEDDRDMEDYLLRQINVLQENEKENVFTNTKLINEITHLGINKDDLEKLILLYKYHFEITKLFLDELFTSLIINQESVPYMIRAICTIISKLFSLKFKNVSNILKYKLFNEFIFNNLIIPILEKPEFNGILFLNLSKDKNRNTQIKAAIKIMNKLLSLELYNCTKNEEYYYTIFNPYFIEIVPFLFDFYREISNAKLPINIEKLLIHKNQDIYNKDIKYNYLSFHPEERLEHQSICMTYKDILTIYNIIKLNETEILGDQTNISFKYYKKITYCEDNLKSKVENDETNSTLTFIYFSKIDYDDNLKKKIDKKKEKNFSFQTDDKLAEKDNAKFILERVKFSFNTIVKHINIDALSNFLNNEKDSTKDFITNLNEIIKLEGFSGMLKEQNLPLEWFGLYLKSNIDNIPLNYKKDNYALLYKELIEDSRQNLLKIQKDPTLNIIYSKIINSEKIIDIGRNNLKRIMNNKIKFEVIDFIKNCNIPVILNVVMENNNIRSINIKEDNKKCKNNRCNNIFEFCDNFPNINIQEKEENDFEFELNLKTNLDNYLQIVFKYLENETNFLDYDVENKAKIKLQIENFIHIKLYNKIFSKNPMKTDNDIASTLNKLSSIKPYSLDKNLRELDEKMVQLMIGIINNINKEKSPLNKLREFENIYYIIKNIIILYGYNENSFINILLYATIKAKPSYLYSTFRYIQIFLNDKIKEDKKFLIEKFSELISKIDFYEKNNNLSKK